MKDRTLLLMVPVSWAGIWTTPLAGQAPGLKLVVHERDAYDPAAIDYVLSFRPPPGVLKTLPNLKAVFSLGAGVDGFLADPDYPRAVPLVRFVHHSLAREMAHYAVLHALLHHRRQKNFDAAQKEHAWRQAFPPRRTEDTRIGIFGMGEIGQVIAEAFRDLDFPVSGWSRTRKTVEGVKSFAGEAERDAFLAQSDILVCVLPLTEDTRGILDKDLFAKLPKDSYLINIARGGHQNAGDLVAAIDSGHLSGATLDVFEPEPLPPSSPLWSHPKITVTPHVAALTDPFVMAKAAVDGITSLERGEKLENVVDFERGY